MQFDFAMVLAFAVAAIGFGLFTLFVGSLLRPLFPSIEKAEIYECGEHPVGSAWFNFNPRFYVVALVFVIFEVEVALTIPVALVFREWVFRHMGGVALAEIGVFIGILTVGLVWIWIRKDLNWLKRVETRPGKVEQLGGSAHG